MQMYNAARPTIAIHNQLIPRNLGAGAIRPVTEKAVRYFILTSRWTESARRGASHHDTSNNDAIPSNRFLGRTMTFIVSLSILRPQSINPGLDSRSLCSFVPSKLRTYNRRKLLDCMLSHYTWLLNDQRY